MDSLPINRRTRVIIDNDFGGDPDGLFQLAHHLLSPSVEIRAVIGSINHAWGFYGMDASPAHAAALAKQVVELSKLDPAPPVFTGAAEAMADHQSPRDTEAARAIVDEAMHEDDRPLFVCAGGGLTNVASALLINPKIAEKFTLVWIGGREHDGLAEPPPGGSQVEYNTSIDLRAAQVVFNESSVPIWQVPRDAYRQALAGYVEIAHHVGRQGPMGAFLMERLNDLLTRANRSLGEGYVLGDNPLVLLSALQSGWEVDPASCTFARVPRPTLEDDGTYGPRPDRKPIRVCTRLDARLMLTDFYAKLAELAAN